MHEISVNGVEVFRAHGFAKGWMRISSAGDTVEALRQFSMWCESTFGLALDHRLIDVLLYIGNPGVAHEGSSVELISGATGLALMEVERVVHALEQAGAVVFRVDAQGAPRLHGTPMLLRAAEEFHERLDSGFIARKALRGALLLNRAGKNDLAGDITRCFDAFFDLGWLYLHNWGANCYLMACLVARAMALSGHRTRVESGYVALKKDGKSFLLGAKDRALPGQIDGHAFCVINDGVLVDFGLGVARRAFRRDLFWAVAAAYAKHTETVAQVEHPRCGRISWHTDWCSPRGEQETRVSQGLATELMRVYPQPSTTRVAHHSLRWSSVLAL